ncbi:MAG: hypothetical protein PHD32_10005 [Eubacteriales bacterium]|nr:hypothetical protein [Eubacteriales bacterium]
MAHTFTETMLFQVRPDRLDEFEELIQQIKAQQEDLPGCLSVKYIKRFYTFDGVENGQPPRALTKIVKCVKYYSLLEFDTIENCGAANGWFFDHYAKDIMKLLIMPFDINSGYSV